jgi:hypothetical protein
MELYKVLNTLGVNVKVFSETEILSSLTSLLSEHGFFLVIGDDKDILFTEKKDGQVIIDTFRRGKADAKSKTDEILRKLNVENGFLDSVLSDAVKEFENGINPFEDPLLTERGAILTRALTDGFEGEKGRGLFVHSVLVSAIKTVCPEQDIRLHKTDWIDGIGMRVIDKKCISAWFNSRNLGVKMNSDGVFMTRSLAVDIPYVPSFPPKIKGPKDEWLELISGMQFGEINPKSALRALLFGAHLRNIEFGKVVDEILESCKKLDNNPNRIFEIIYTHINGRKNGGSRLLEIALHSYAQVCFEEDFKIPTIGKNSIMAPIKPMRSPDKKAGDVGDIQFRHESFIDEKGSRYIEYAIDAKFGKSISDYEIDRLLTHLHDEETPQPYLTSFDFIGLDKPNLNAKKIHLFDEQNLPNIRAISLNDFVKEIDPNGSLTMKWLKRYVSMLSTQDLGYGQVTEITTDWLLSLYALLEKRS